MKFRIVILFISVLISVVASWRVFPLPDSLTTVKYETKIFKTPAPVAPTYTSEKSSTPEVTVKPKVNDQDNEYTVPVIANGTSVYKGPTAGSVPTPAIDLLPPKVRQTTIDYEPNIFRNPVPITYKSDKSFQSKIEEAPSIHDTPNFKVKSNERKVDVQGAPLSVEVIKASLNNISTTESVPTLAIDLLPPYVRETKINDDSKIPGTPVLLTYTSDESFQPKDDETPRIEVTPNFRIEPKVKVEVKVDTQDKEIVPVIYASEKKYQPKIEEVPNRIVMTNFKVAPIVVIENIEDTMPVKAIKTSLDKEPSTENVSVLAIDLNLPKIKQTTTISNTKLLTTPAPKTNLSEKSLQTEVKEALSTEVTTTPQEEPTLKIESNLKIKDHEDAVPVTNTSENSTQPKVELTFSTEVKGNVKVEPNVIDEMKVNVNNEKALPASGISVLLNNKTTIESVPTLLNTLEPIPYTMLKSSQPKTEVSTTEIIKAEPKVSVQDNKETIPAIHTYTSQKFSQPILEVTPSINVTPNFKIESSVKVEPKMNSKNNDENSVPATYTSVKFSQPEVVVTPNLQAERSVKVEPKAVLKDNENTVRVIDDSTTESVPTLLVALVPTKVEQTTINNEPEPITNTNENSFQPKIEAPTTEVTPNFSNDELNASVETKVDLQDDKDIVPVTFINEKYSQQKDEVKLSTEVTTNFKVEPNTTVEPKVDLHEKELVPVTFINEKSSEQKDEVKAIAEVATNFNKDSSVKGGSKVNVQEIKVLVGNGSATTKSAPPLNVESFPSKKLSTPAPVTYTNENVFQLKVDETPNMEVKTNFQVESRNEVEPLVDIKYNGDAVPEAEITMLAVYESTTQNVPTLTIDILPPKVKQSTIRNEAKILSSPASVTYKGEQPLQPKIEISTTKPNFKVQPNVIIDPKEDVQVYEVIVPVTYTSEKSSQPQVVEAIPGVEITGNIKSDITIEPKANVHDNNNAVSVTTKKTSLDQELTTESLATLAVDILPPKVIETTINYEQKALKTPAPITYTSKKSSQLEFEVIPSIEFPPHFKVEPAEAKVDAKDNDDAVPTAEISTSFDKGSITESISTLAVDRLPPKAAQITKDNEVKILATPLTYTNEKSFSSVFKQAPRIEFITDYKVETEVAVEPKEEIKYNEDAAPATVLRTLEKTLTQLRNLIPSLAIELLPPKNK